MLKIISSAKKSVARKLKIPKGELVAFDGKPSPDMLDVAYFDCMPSFDITVKNENGESVFHIEKDTDQPLGLIFDEDSYLNSRRCCNKCIFCFVDQLPKGLRDTLYVKDDDWRMSFACGSYVTLTNLTSRDIDRIIERHYSPLYISVHATETELRQHLLGNKKAMNIMQMLKLFAEKDITMHTQIVLCSGINDGEHLKKSLDDLYSLYPQVKSVAIVPVGLTTHRDNLQELVPYTRDSARAVISEVELFDKKVFDREKEHFAFCSDEFYLDAELETPNAEFYGDFDQIENGVGLLAQFEEEFDMALSDAKGAKRNSFSIITGVSATPFIEKQIAKARERFPALDIEVITIRNDFFGRSVTVAGLITGGDIIKQTSNKQLKKTVLIPSVMLREFEDIFLDGVTKKQLEKALKRKIFTVSGGYDLVKHLCKGDYR